MIKDKKQFYANLEDKFGDQFYLFERARFIKNIGEFHSAFLKEYPRVVLSHSYKTNYTPAIAAIAKDKGLYAEVVSEMEYSMALKVGYEPPKIIFNGPIKTKACLSDALLKGAIVNIDHLAEVNEICKIATANPEHEMSVGIRCNADFGARERSRFGMAEDSGELAQAFKELREQNNINVVGIHIHTSAIRTIDSYRLRVEFAIEVINKYFTSHLPGYINLGGGFPSNMPEEIRRQIGMGKTNYALYAQAICRSIKKVLRKQEEPPLLILEPGVALFANIFKLFSKVLAVKQINNRNLAILSASIHTIKPTGHNVNMPLSHISCGDSSGSLHTWDLTGYTCMEHDILYRGYVGEIRPGDYFIFKQVGAYTTVFKPPFIKEAPPIVEIYNNQVNVLRQRETANHILSCYTEVN